MTGLSRAQLLQRATAGGVALAVGGGALGGTASAAIGAGDVPRVTQAVAGELLGAAFYTQLLRAKLFGPGTQRAFARALTNERAHYAALAKVLTDAGQVPGTADDFDFTFPKGAFAGRMAAARLGVQLETAFLGICLGGASSLQDPTARQLFARSAANQAQHLSVFSDIAQNKPIGLSFPPGLSLEDGSAALDPFIS